MNLYTSFLLMLKEILRKPEKKYSFGGQTAKTDIVPRRKLDLIPAGRENHGAVVEVVGIEYFSEETALMLIDKTRYIIRKCKDDYFANSYIERGDK